MADHSRQQVVDAVKTALTGLSTTGARVFDFPVRPLEAATELPGICVYFNSDEAVLVTIAAPALYQRSAELVVLGAAQLNSQVDRTLNDIGKEVEIALAAGLTVGGHDLEFIYTGSELEREPGEKEYGTITVRFSVQIFTAAGAPDVLT